MMRCSNYSGIHGGCVDSGASMLAMAVRLGVKYLSREWKGRGQYAI